MKKLLMIIAFILLITPTVDAAKIDVYREMLQSGNYTIRYENLTPAPRITNKNNIELYGKNGLAVEGNDFFLNRPLSGIITSNNENRYEEVGYADFFQCRLMREGENFLFTRYKNKKDELEYFGIKKNQVEANSRNYLTELIAGESFGDPDFTKMMNAIIADNNKSADMMKYKFVASGTLDSGLEFEDFCAEDELEISAIRYYFDDDNLTKIAFASYGRDKDGAAFGSKCIVRVLSFTNTPDETLLKLPAKVRDVTKR